MSDPDLRHATGVLPSLPFTDALARAGQEVSRHYQSCTPGRETLDRAMQHALIGGKTLRGFLVLESCRLHGIEAHLSVGPALAIECVHAYSLVHDDLPCMDDDDLRRGQPTVHKRWDEATAVLAGDALQTLAFEVLADEKYGLSGLKLIHRLARLAGREGMVRGQMQDIAAESADTPLTLDAITDLQRNKTGKLISWSCSVGPLLARADERPLANYAEAIGLAFQIADDVLDVEGDAATVGKATGKDSTAGKATFVSHLGLDGAKQRAKTLVQNACDALSDYGSDADTLREAAHFVVARKS